MAVIAPSRNLVSTGDFIRLSVGACNVAFGSFYAVIGNISAQAVAGTTCILGQHTSTNEGKGLLLWVSEKKFGIYNGTTSLLSAIAVEAGEGNLFLGWTKATGASKVRFYKYKYSTSTWTIEEPATTLANATAIPAGTLRFNEWQNTEFSTMNLYAAGIKGAALSEAEMKALAEARYLGKWGTLSSPAGAWLFNQKSTAEEVKDLTAGGANQSAITGTTVSASAEPPVPFWPAPPFASRTARNALLRR